MRKLQLARTTTLLTSFLASLLMPLFLSTSAYAASGFYFSPSSTSITKNSTKTLGFRINPSSAINAVVATVHYDKAKLQLVSYSPTSAFPNPFGESSGNGTIVISRTVFSAHYTRDTLIANITFKALSSGGSTPVTLSDTQALNNGDAVSAGASGASVTLLAAPSGGGGGGGTHTGGGSGSGSTGGSSSGSTKDTPKDTAKKSAVTISANVTSLQFNTVTIELTGDKPFKGYIQYWQDEQATVKSPVSSKFATKQTIVLDKKSMTPGNMYQFKAFSISQSGGTYTTEAQSFKTKGYKIVVRLLDSQNMPLAKKKVVLHSDPVEGTTNSKGAVEFTDLEPGTHTITYNYKGKDYSRTIYVEDNAKVDDSGQQTAADQNIAVVFDDLTLPTNNSMKWLAAFVILLVIVGVVFGLRWLVKNKPINLPGPHSPKSDALTHDSSHKESGDAIDKIEGSSNPNPGSVVKPKDQE